MLESINEDILSKSVNIPRRKYTVDGSARPVRPRSMSAKTRLDPSNNQMETWMTTINEYDDLSFGTTQDRSIFPSSLPPSRIGLLNTNSGDPKRGPGRYENHEKSSFIHENEVKPTSARGLCMSARTGPRSLVFTPTKIGAPFSSARFETPAPLVYQNDQTRYKFKKPISAAQKPFGSDGEMLPSLKVKQEVILKPGLGSYEHDINRNRQANAGNIKSAVPIMSRLKSPSTDICDSCLRCVKGDYYKFRNVSVCARCYNYNLRWGDKYSPSYLLAFYKVKNPTLDRAANNIETDMKSPKILRPEEVNPKVKKWRAYLSLYFA